jgi:nifR3 family TIM-barrel protein
VSVPVTVKMRLGWCHATLNAPELARRAEDLGVAAVTVHGRTRQQFYKGRADWRAIRAVVEAVRIPVTANGDVESPADARACLEQSGAAAVMVGRAAMGRPWLVGRIGADLDGRPFAEPSPEARMLAAVEHYEGLLSLYGEGMGVRHARKHLAAYADVARAEGYGLAPRERERLVTSTSPAEVRDLLRGLYAARLAEAA